MKKTFFIIIIFSCINSNAQDTRMGLYLSPCINWISTNDNTESGSNIGFNYGYGIEFSLSENHFIESGFELSHRGGDINNVNYNLQYINLPIHIKMKSRSIGYWKYFAKTGPSLGFRVKERVRPNNVQENEKNSKSALLIINISIGAEYSLGNNTAVHGELFFQNNITDGLNYTNTESSLLNQIGIRLGFFF